MRSTRRGGRRGVDVLGVLDLCFSKGLLILDKGAKIPIKKWKNKNQFVSQYVGF